MTTTEEKHPNDKKKKRGRLAKREIRIPITQDSIRIMKLHTIYM